MMGTDSEDARTFDLVSGAAAMAAGVLVRHGVRALWRRGRGEPPEDPAAPDVDWREAIAWTVSLGVAVGVARLLTRRGVRSAWRRVFDEDPA